MIAALFVVASGGVAFASITSPTGNPFVVPGDGAGNPVAVTIVANGWTPGQPVNVEECDGVSPSLNTWDVTQDCDNGASPPPVLADSSGNATFTAGGPHSFTPFKNQSPSGLFNCLSPHDPALSGSDGLNDYRNCSIRVASSNTQKTGDQVFLNIQLPDAIAGTTTSTTTSTTMAPTTTTTIPATGTPAGSCTGEQLTAKAVGTDSANVGLTDQSHRVTLSAALQTNLATKAKIAGTCTGLVEPADSAGGAVPATLHPKAFALKVSGIASCASTSSARAADATSANAFALSGLVTITMTETDALGKPFSIQAHITAKGYAPASTDVLEFTGIVNKGPSLGATVSGKLYVDPITKITPAPKTGTGYAFDSATLAHCTDGTANNASVAIAQIGDGTSLAGTTGVSGLSFSYRPAASGSVGTCSGEQLTAKAVGTDTANAGLTDQSHRVTLTGALQTNLATKAKIAGTCAGLVEPADNAGGAAPATLHPKAIALKLSGIASCASTTAAQAADATAANAFPLSGLVTFTMTETDALGKPFQVQAYVTVKGYDSASTDVLAFTGLIIKGPSLGATVSGKLYVDPITKIVPAPKTGTGYAFDSATLSHCTDGTANNASVALAQLGDGTSLLGTTGVSGLSFAYPAAS